MPHIHNEPGQHDLTVSAFIVNSDLKPRLLIHKHKTLNAWLQIGGHVELHEDPWTAMLREIREETAIPIDQLSLYVPPYSFFYKNPYNPFEIHPQPVVIDTHGLSGNLHFHTDLAYAFKVPKDVDVDLHSLAEDESHEFLWIENYDLYFDKLPILHKTRKIGRYILDEVVDMWDLVKVSSLV